MSDPLFDRGYQIRQRLRPAMLALRDAEDWARLELRDEVLAERIRGIHEALTDDILNGRTSRETTRRKAKLWDRYCRLRRHDPDASVRAHTRHLRRLGLRKVTA